MPHRCFTYNLSHDGSGPDEAEAQIAEQLARVNGRLGAVCGPMIDVFAHAEMLDIFGDGYAECQTVLSLWSSDPDDCDWFDTSAEDIAKAALMGVPYDRWREYVER
jgi:hypothetical protein